MRHPSSIPIEVKEGDPLASVARQPETPTVAASRLQNVSIGGLAFEAENELAVGCIVALKINFVRPVFSTRARVVWCRPAGDHFELGVEFLEASDVFRARMVEQVCHIEQHRQYALKNEGRSLTSEQAAHEWIARFASKFPQFDS